MKAVNILVFICLISSCNFFGAKNKPYQILKEYSGLLFSKQDVLIEEFDERKAGISEEGTLQAVYKIKNPNFDSLTKILIGAGYESLPIHKIQLGNGFNGNIKESDIGFYKLDLQYESVIKQLVIFNYTQKKIVVYGII